MTSALFPRRGQRRNWHADTCIDWRHVRRDHSDAVATIIEGFFAVEQYTPDYVGPLLHLIRGSYGRSQWHLHWGAEEVRHADLWRHAVVALGRRDQRWMDEYASELRRNEWALPWDSPRHILFYQVIQEPDAAQRRGRLHGSAMDWWICYRTETDMRELAALLQVDPSQVRTTTFLSSESRVAWLQIDRLG